MNRLQSLLAERIARGEKSLAVFLTAGFPTKNATVGLVASLAAAGADIVELGMPFSDPLADGPVIQECSATALANGITLQQILDDVRAIRSSVSIPIVLMGYLNPILRFGVDRFFRAAGAAGVDGIILPEVPLEESGRFADYFTQTGISPILLVSPSTSSERMREIDARSGGFVYCVSRTGVTGAPVHQETKGYLSRAREHIVHNPLLVGFGIATPEDAARIATHADGIIVGSAFLKRLKDDSRRAMQWVGELKKAIS